MALIQFVLDFGFVDGSEECRPATSRIVFGVGGEKRLSASGAFIDAVFVVHVKLTRVRSFGTLLPEDAILLRRKLFTQFIF
jgi:hypothetical protein